MKKKKIIEKMWLSRGQPIEVNTEIGVVEFVYFLNIGEIMKICLSLFVQKFILECLRYELMLEFQLENR